MGGGGGGFLGWRRGVLTFGAYSSCLYEEEELAEFTVEGGFKGAFGFPFFLFLFLLVFAV